MPKAIKKRVVKKTGLDDADVKTMAAHAWDNINGLIKDKKKEATIAVSVAGLIVVISAAFLLYNSSIEKKARGIEMDANKIFYPSQPGSLGEDKLKKALGLYQSSVDTKITPTALFSLGNSYFKLGNYENAIKEYNRFVSKFGKEDEILPLVYQKLASAYSRTGKNDQALDALHKLAALNNGIFKDTALVLEARNYAAAGNNDMALTKYEELAKTFPSSPWKAEATAKIADKNKPVATGTEEKAPK
ncbi:MAG: tetratricopeptide repeat protein [Thermodesulfovibrionia bacterium]|nr:tetratricopeptide repeat protein [Thermodesulfovibrionia bacterium]